MPQRLSLLIGLLLFTPSAHAQDAADDAARRQAAQALFEQGVVRFDRGDPAGAEQSFRDSLAARESASVRFNLAIALSAQGRILDAQQTLEQVLANPDIPESLRADAAERARELSDRVARLVVHSEVESRFAVDRDELGPEMLGEPIRVDPGRHTVRLLGARDAAAREVTLAEGAAREVRFVAADLEGPGVSPIGPILLAVGGAALIVSAITVGLAIDARDRLQRESCGGGTRCSPGYRDTLDEAYAYAGATDGLLIGGAIVAVAGATWLLVELLTGSGDSLAARPGEVRF